MAAGLVLGFDDSAGARAALAVALELARPARRAAARRVRRAAARPPSARRRARTATRSRRSVSGSWPRRSRPARAAGVEAHAHVARERPVDLLLRLADEHDARLIVVGSYGESPLRGAVLGSTPHKLLHLSERPVLAVPGASRRR